jgi:hypothetical protein
MEHQVRAVEYFSLCRIDGFDIVTNRQRDIYAVKCICECIVKYSSRKDLSAFQIGDFAESLIGKKQQC